MPLAQVDGGALYYESVGDGTPLLLLLPQSKGPVGRQALIEGLSARHQIISYDQRGTGQSPASAQADEFSMASLAAEVGALVEYLQLDQVHLLCHSTGCGIGISAATSFPERVSSLILTTPWTYADPHLFRAQNLRIACARVLDPEQYARYNNALLFPPEFRRTYQAQFEKLATNAWDTPHNADDIARRLGAILAFDARPHLSAIACPTLVVTAKDDQLMPAWFGVEAAENIAGAKLVEFNGGGHMLPETRTADLITTVLAFFDDLEAPA